MLTQIYKKEFESTPITLHALKAKYHLEHLPEESEDWIKTLVEEPKTLVTNAEPKSPQTIVSTNNSIQEYKLQDDVDKAKQLIMKNALTILAEEITDISIKEFKDIVSIVDSMDNKKQDDSQQQINIQINNMIQGFKDDC